MRSKATVGDLVVERESTFPLNMQNQKKSQTIVEEPQLVRQLQEVGAATTREAERRSSGGIHSCTDFQ